MRRLPQWPDRKRGVATMKLGRPKAKAATAGRRLDPASAAEGGGAALSGRETPYSAATGSSLGASRFALAAWCAASGSSAAFGRTSQRHSFAVPIAASSMIV